MVNGTGRLNPGPQSTEVSSIGDDVVVRGVDTNGTERRLKLDDEGRIRLAASVEADIGDVNLLDTNDNQIDPATEGTLSSVDDALSNGIDIVTGQETVGTPGTAEALNGGTGISVPDGQSVAVIALPDNSGSVFVGDSTVDSSSGVELVGGAGVEFDVDDVSKVFVDALNANDGVSWKVVT
jgi:hypothetical protein